MLICTLMVAMCLTVGADMPRVYTVDPAKLAQTRERAHAGDASLKPALDAVRDRAEAALDESLSHIADKPEGFRAPTGDVHDYVSVSVYAWPDPNDPTRTWQLIDGKRNHEAVNTFDSPKIASMSRRVIALTQGWYFLDDRRYARAAAEQLRAFFINPATRMNPHMEYAQMLPPAGKGKPWGIIDANQIPQVLNGVGMLADSGEWSEADDAALRAWFGEFARWLVTSELGIAEGHANNNHGTFYDLMLASSAAYAGDHDLAQRVLAEAGPRRLATQIMPNGSTPHEQKRVNAAGYTLWNIEGLLDLAEFAERYDIDLWNYQGPQGQGLRTIATFLEPFAIDATIWNHGADPMKPAGPTAYFWRASIAYEDPHMKQILEEHLLSRDPMNASPLRLFHPRD